MVKVLFICHGNICRSVAAEMIMRQLLEQNKLSNISADSAAVSSEEIGNDIFLILIIIYMEVKVLQSAKNGKDNGRGSET